MTFYVKLCIFYVNGKKTTPQISNWVESRDPYFFVDFLKCLHIVNMRRWSRMFPYRFGFYSCIRKGVELWLNGDGLYFIFMTSLFMNVLVIFFPSENITPLKIQISFWVCSKTENRSDNITKSIMQFNCISLNREPALL